MGQRFGHARVQREVERNAAAEPGDLVQRIVASVGTSTGDAAVADDVTVMVIRYVASEGAAVAAQ